MTNSFQDRDQESFWGKVFAGSPTIQIIRSIVYALIALITVIAVGFTIAGIVAIPSGWETWKRKRLVASLPGLEDSERARKQKAVEKVFINSGLPGLTKVQRLLANNQKLKTALKRHQMIYGGGTQVVMTPKEREEMHRRRIEINVSERALGTLAAAQLVQLDGADEVKD